MESVTDGVRKQSAFRQQARAARAGLERRQAEEAHFHPDAAGPVVRDLRGCYFKRFAGHPLPSFCDAL